MRRKHALLTLTLALSTALIAPAAPVGAAPNLPAPPRPLREAPANGADRNDRAAQLPKLAPRQEARAERRDVRGYPRQTVLRTYAVDPEDRSLRLGVIPYYAIAPRLNALQARSRRVSAEVIGQSARGRDLYLVTGHRAGDGGRGATAGAHAPLIEENPLRVPLRTGSSPRLQAPRSSSTANIHGNEWEGTDGVPAA
jgi:hypothetical protein